MPKLLNPDKMKIGYQKEYVDKDYEIKVMRRKGQEAGKRYKAALWWATMNNLPYDVLQFFWFPLSLICGKIGFVLHNKCDQILLHLAGMRILSRATLIYNYSGAMDKE